MPETSRRVSSRGSPSPIIPAQPLGTPSTLSPEARARRATARIAAFRPGASPPPVRTPMRMSDPHWQPLVGQAVGRAGVARRDRADELEPELKDPAVDPPPK